MSRRNNHSFKEHNVSFNKLDKKWKVHDPADRKKTKVHAKKGEQITWEAGKSDIYFQFPDVSLFGEHTMMLEKGQKMSLKVNPNANAGKHSYAAFCLDDKCFAEGNSPPEIIVEAD